MVTIPLSPIPQAESPETAATRIVLDDANCPECGFGVMMAHKHGDGTWRVPSASTSGLVYTVRFVRGPFSSGWVCQCRAAEYGNDCWHLRLVRAREDVLRAARRVQNYPVTFLPSTDYELFDGDEFSEPLKRGRLDEGLPVYNELPRPTLESFFAA